MAKARVTGAEVIIRPIVGGTREPDVRVSLEDVPEMLALLWDEYLHAYHGQPTVPVVFEIMGAK